jgi:hypothetical protein
LAAKTVQVRALLQQVEDDYEAVYYIGALCDHFKQKHNLSDPANRAKKNAHEAFVEYFNKHKHLHGLQKAGYVPASPASSGASSVPASPLTP